MILITLFNVTIRSVTWFYVKNHFPFIVKILLNHWATLNIFRTKYSQFQVRSKSSCSHRKLYLLSLLHLLRTPEKIYPMFSILFPRENPFRRKKEENEAERVVWTRLNLSLSRRRGWEGWERKANDENTEGGYKIAEVTAQAEVPIAS